MQDDNSPCKGMIENSGWHPLLVKEQFSMRRNNSRCKMTHKSPRNQGCNSTCDVTVWTCIVTMQHSTPQFKQQFNMLVGTGYWNGRRCSRPGTGPTQAYKNKDGGRDTFYSPKSLSFSLQCSWANSMVRVDTQKSCSDTFRASRVNSKDLGMGYSQTSKLLWNDFSLFKLSRVL